VADIEVMVIDGEQSRELRRSVLRPQLPAGSPMPGDDHPEAVHLGAYRRSILVSACLIFAESCPWLPDRPAWRLRSMATDPGARRSGGGSAILVAAAEIAGARGATVLWCLARESAAAFYAANGWLAQGELFDTEFGPHLRMWRTLQAADGDS
jgi:GNAT superfamily N-acetyltransferase